MEFSDSKMAKNNDTKEFKNARTYRKIKNYIERLVYANPFLECLVKELRFRILIFSTRLRRRKDIEINKIIWVDPKNINYISIELDPFLNMGRVMSGKWDKYKIVFEDSYVYMSFKSRFIDGNEWKNTKFYKKILSDIAKGLVPWGCGNKNELDDRMKKIDNLYYEIKDNGYKSNKEIGKISFQREDEVTVNIGRNGEMLFNDGRHRLAIAKILNIPKIPVKVVVRHSNWVKLREELIQFSLLTDGKLYQKLAHPDLQDISYKYSSLRYDIIKKNLSIRSGTVVDFGAQLGYFCDRFDEDGFNCYAIENDPICIYFMRILKKINNRKYKIITQSIFEYYRGKDLSFDIVLAMNIFHHFLKTKESYKELIILLRRIKAKEMFFQSHGYYEPQMNGAYKNFHPEEFAQFISKHTNLKYKLIGEGENGRSIFKFSIADAQLDYKKIDIARAHVQYE